MSDPKRWCDDPRALADRERRVLLADARLNPPPQAKTELWAGLVEAVGAGGAAMPDCDASPLDGTELLGNGAARAGHGLSLGGAVKSACVGIGIGTSVAVVSHYSVQSKREVTTISISSTPSDPAPSVASSVSRSKVVAPSTLPDQDRRVNDGDGTVKSTASMPISEQNIEPSPAQGLDLSDRNRQPTGVRTTPGSVADFAPESPNARDESLLIASARTALRSGNAAFALQLLERAESRFPQGILVQEREALRVESLAALGRTAEARTRADAFVRAYPKSPHLGRVSGYATQ